MNPSGKPDAGNRPVRFDEGGGVSVGYAVPTLQIEWVHMIIPSTCIY
jgi:hypothetical protein